MSDFPATADILIVGGGSTGAILAARLSQDPARTVLLEAGPAYEPDAFPASILDAEKFPVADHGWNYTSRGTDQAPSIPTRGARCSAAAPR